MNRYEIGRSKIEIYDDFVSCEICDIKSNLSNFYKVILEVYGDLNNWEDYFYSLDEIHILNNYILLE